MFDRGANTDQIMCVITTTTTASTTRREMLWHVGVMMNMVTSRAKAFNRIETRIPIDKKQLKEHFKRSSSDDEKTQKNPQVLTAAKKI
jgi:hypothetical protein